LTEDLKKTTRPPSDEEEARLIEQVKHMTHIKSKSYHDFTENECKEVL